ncbi:MAG: electron transport complex subunit RsxE [Gammaproteobacteria bacterium]
MKDQTFRSLLHDNPVLFRMIGLSPLLAISYSLTLSISLGIIFFIVLTITSLIVSTTRYFIPPPAAIPCYVLITATLVTIIDLLMQAWFPDLRSALGIYLLIIAVNCLILDRIIVFASQNNIIRSVRDAAFHGFAIFLVLVVLGAFRELIAHGSLFKDIELLTGESGKIFSLKLAQNNKAFILASLPAGAFICLGLLIALSKLLKITSSNKTDQ